MRRNKEKENETDGVGENVKAFVFPLKSCLWYNETYINTHTENYDMWFYWQ